ncbi:MAG: ureidoglycolate lyase [Actinomycetota bacterium]
MTRAHATAVPCSEADVSPYGRYVNLATGGPGVVDTAGPGFSDRYTSDALIGSGGHLGLTAGPELPSSVHQMERHLHTSEAVFCSGDPVILPVAAPTEARPRTVDVEALLISRGECVILDPGVWHAPCVGVDGPAVYYWFAAVDEALQDDWIELDNGPVAIELAEESLV